MRVSEKEKRVPGKDTFIVVEFLRENAAPVHPGAVART
jgi:hypothetical protein